MQTLTFPICRLSSTVLGYNATSPEGRPLWNELDWSAVSIDGGQHVLNCRGGEYLHVLCKHDPDKDEPGGYRRWYRVRCRYQPGSVFRRQVVKDVKVRQEGDRWMWEITLARDGQL